MIFQCIHQTQSSLTYQMPTLFSKEHVISGIQIIYFADETHLTLQKVTQVIQIVRVIRPTFNPGSHACSYIAMCNNNSHEGHYKQQL